MGDLIVVHPDFDGVWPFAADHFHALWPDADFLRLAHGDDRPLGGVATDAGNADRVTRLAALGMPVTVACLERFGALRQATFQYAYGRGLDEDCGAYLAGAGVSVYDHPSEGFWSQSVAEFGLALTLCGLRRIPQLHREIIHDQAPWDYEPPGGQGRPGARGQQFGDDPGVSRNGTLAGKRGADRGRRQHRQQVCELCFDAGRRRGGLGPVRRGTGLSPRRSPPWSTTWINWSRTRRCSRPWCRSPSRRPVWSGPGHIDALPRGCLVVLVTRALICDMDAIRRRVMADELSLAADVWDEEPLPPDDPLLGRRNVVHTPHNAGRTIDANRAWAEKLAAQFRPGQEP